MTNKKNLAMMRLGKRVRAWEQGGINLILINFREE